MEHRAAKMPAELLEHTNWLRSLARQLVSDANTADDVVQATLIAALAWGERPREGVRNWLAGVARNVARQIGRGEKRRSRREIRGATPEALPSAGEMVELVETQRALATAVLGLAEHYRSTIVLRFFEELTPTQIARQLDIPASTVRVRLKRGLELLRERLEAEYKDDERHWAIVLLPLAMPPRGAALAPLGGGTGGGLMGLSVSVLVKSGLLALAIGLASVVYWANSSEDAGHLSEGIGLEQSEIVGDRPSTAQEVVETDRTAAGSNATGPEIKDPLTVEDCCIVGRVEDEKGQPVSGARVEAVGAQPRAPQILEVLPDVLPAPSTTTDADGIYRLEVPADQPYLVRVTHANFAPAESPKSFAHERRDLQLSAGHTLTLKVLEARSQAPLDGVQVRFSSVEGLYMPNAWSVAAITDEIGEVSISHVPPGEFRALASIDGYATSEWVGVTGDELGLEHELRLEVAVTLGGVVLDAATDRPVVGARVSGAEQEVTTDHLGRFELDGFAQGSSELEGVLVIADDFAPKAEYVRIDTLGPDPHLVVRLTPPARVTGRVVDGLGMPLAGVEVGYRGRFSSSPMKAERHAGRTVTDEFGRFEVSLHPRAGYTIGAQKPGFPMTSTWIGLSREPLGVVDVGDLVLEEACVVRGLVRERPFDREDPDLIEVRKVIPQRGEHPSYRQLLRVVSVTPSGHFVMDRLSAGVYELTLKGPDKASSSGWVILARHHLSIRAGEVIEDLILRPTPPIRGFVRLADGRVPAKGLVGLRLTKDGKKQVSDKIGADGSFEIVPPGPGPFFLTARDPELLHLSMTLEGVMAGQEGIEFVLQPRATGHTVRGRVLDVHGEPVGGVKIQFTNATTRAIVARVAVPDARGWFSLDNLDDVAYDLRVMDFEGRFEPASLTGVRPGDEGVELQLQPHGD